MSLFGSCAFIIAIASAPLSAQVPTGSDDVARVGPGVTPPRVLRKVEPEYSPLARADQVQGTVVFQIVINEKGRPTDITVLSPLGYGLDERAQAAIETWEFAPGRKDGKPVKILGTVEVAFRFPDIWFDERAERRRTSFNVALQSLNRANASAAAIDNAVRSIQDLPHQKFPPAMCALGLMEITGDHVAANPDGGLALVQRAAAKDYGPALYEIAHRRIEGARPNERRREGA